MQLYEVRSFVFLALGTFLIWTIQSSPAQAQGIIGTRVGGDSKSTAYDRAVRERICQNWSPFKLDKTDTVVIFTIKCDGRVIAPMIQRPESSVENIFAGLDAVLSSSPLPPVPQSSSNTAYQGGAPGKIHFSEDLPKPDLTAYALFLREHPSLKSKCVVLHLIPLDVLQRYPGLFRKSELQGLTNLRGISTAFLCSSNDCIDSKNRMLYVDTFFRNKNILGFYADWERFFQQHPTSSKSDILQQQQRLLAKYKHLFLSSPEGS